MSLHPSIVGFIESASSVVFSVLITGKAITKKVTDPALITKVKDAVKNGMDGQALLELVDPTLLITKHPSGLFGVKDGLVYIGTEALPDTLSDRIIRFAKEGLPFAPLLKFWENVKQNPNPRAKTDLYKFLEHNGHPITSDGCFIAYRAVRNDFKDKYTGTIDNSVGKVVTMDRSLVNPDPNQTCSHGLHVASYDYARNHYGQFGIQNSDILLEVKVDPKFVVSVPVDYNMQKMRVCEYIVMAVNAEGVIQREMYDAPINNVQDGHEDESAWDEDGDDDNIWEDESDDTTVTAPYKTQQSGNSNWKSQKRDSNGRFIKS